MALLTIVEADVALVRGDDIAKGPAAETITAGAYVRFNTSNGKVELGNDTSTAEGRKGGIALNGGIAGQTIEFVRRGYVDLGDAFTSMNYDDIVYLSDTDGRLADTAGTTGRVVGATVPALGATTPDKILRIEFE